MTEISETKPYLEYLADREYFRRQRPTQLKQEIPDIWDYGSVLYVGARTDRMDFGKDFKLAGYEIDVLEIFEPNVQYLKTVEFINHVIRGDVRQARLLVQRTYDIVFWWHGPEHIEKSDLGDTLNGLRLIAEELVVCACPWGGSSTR